ncbi:hypothetical protein ES703_54830 [subsurface metagenome]
MDNIFTDRMAPGHITPLPAVWIMLIKQVILPIVIDHPVGIVVPAAAGSEMKLRTQLFPIQILLTDKSICLIDRIEPFALGRFILIYAQNGFFTFKLADIQKHPEISLIRSQLDIKFTDHLVIDNEPYQAFVSSVLDREV